MNRNCIQATQSRSFWGESFTSTRSGFCWVGVVLGVLLVCSPLDGVFAYQVLPHKNATTEHTLTHNELTRIILSKYKARWMWKNNRDKLFVHAVIWEDSYSKGGGSYYAYMRNSKVKVEYRKNATTLNPHNWYKNAMSFRRHFFNPYAKHPGLIMTTRETLNLIEHRAARWSQKRSKLPKFLRKIAFNLLSSSAVVARKISGKQNSALWWAQQLWAKAIKYAKSKDPKKRETSIHYLGRVIHLIEDMASLAHVLLINHGGEFVGGPKVRVGKTYGIEPWASLQPLRAPKGGWRKAIHINSVSEAFHKMSKFTIKQVAPFHQNLNTRLSTSIHPARSFREQNWKYGEQKLRKVLTIVSNQMIGYALGLLDLYERRSKINEMDAKFPQSTKLSVGNTCTQHFRCNNGACGRETAAKGTKRTCCRSGRTTGHAMFDYCVGMPSGSWCWSNKMCASGLCVGNLHGVKKGKCAPKGTRKMGALCTKHQQCNNGACGRETAAKGIKRTCCRSGRTVRYTIYDYCAEMPRGSRCWSNKMCASGTCMGDLNGVKKGECK